MKKENKLLLEKLNGELKIDLDNVNVDLLYSLIKIIAVKKELSQIIEYELNDNNSSLLTEEFVYYLLHKKSVLGYLYERYLTSEFRSCLGNLLYDFLEKEKSKLKHSGEIDE